MAGPFSSEFTAEFGSGQSGGGDDFMPISPTASVTLSVGNTSARILIPTAGTPTFMLITNLSQTIVFLAFGDATVVAGNGNLPLLPYSQIQVTIGTFTYVAAVSLSGASTINVTTST